MEYRGDYLDRDFQSDIMNFIIISIGNELLSGDVVNTNATFLAKKITKLGHRVVKIVVIPDLVEVISEEVRKASDLADFVLVTGGLGATHDDVTSEAVAKAFGKKLTLNDAVYRRLKDVSCNDKAIRKISTVPEGCEIVWNDVGAAPAFIVENVAVMPGVPAEMENTFNKIIKRFGREEYYEEILEVSSLEEEIVEKLNKVVKEFPEVQIGSYPKRGFVLIKFSGKDSERVRKARLMLQNLLNVTG